MDTYVAFVVMTAVVIDTWVVLKRRNRRNRKHSPTRG